MKKSIVYTKTGDNGTTSLAGGKMVAKSDIRLESYGSRDELNSFTGLLMAELQDPDDISFLHFVQHKLFALGAYLATPPESAAHGSGNLTPACIERIEREIDRIDNLLPSIKNFLLPGGCRTAALAHVCRTVCRRAERLVYHLHESAPVESNVLVFINRLSDYFFVLARKECLRNKGEEIIWDNSCS